MTTPSDLIIDSHHHFWDLSKFDYYWMPPPPSVVRQNYLPNDLAPILERNGISKTVLVQAHKSVDEANWLLDIANTSEFVAGVVAWVDLTKPDAGNVLDELMKRPKLVGIRHQVEDDPDEAWLSRDESIRGLKEVAERGLAYDVLVKPQHLKYLSSLAEKLPNLRLVVDHIAKPLIAEGIMEPWASDIKAVADIPGVYCKVSGMVTEADHAKWIVEDLKPYVSHIIDTFGFDRLMYGSDWPVCLLASDYDRMYRATLEAIGPVSDDDRAKFLGLNASDFYRL